MAKQKFKITNWHDYNKALRQRGSLTVWIDASAIAAWIDKTPSERRGRPFHYTDMAITTILMLKRVFNLSLRATQGFIDSIFQLMGVALSSPDYSLVSKRAKNVKISIAKRLNFNYNIDISYSIIFFCCKVLFVREKEGLSIRETAKRFHIGLASVSRWLNQINPKPSTTRQRKIDKLALEKDVEL